MSDAVAALALAGAVDANAVINAAAFGARQLPQQTTTQPREPQITPTSTVCANVNNRLP